MQPTKAQVAARKKKEQERKAAEANRPRPGAGSSARQAEQNKYKKPAAAKPAAKSAAKPKVADYSDAQGNVYDGNTGRLKKAAAPSGASAAPKVKPSPAPSSRPSSTSARSSGGGSTQSSAKTSSSPSQSTPVKNDSYGSDGKGLYNAHKGDNPLLKRFRKDMGRNPETGNKTDGVGPVADGKAYAESTRNADLERAKSDANKAKIKQGPPQPAAPAKPASPNEKPDVGYKPNTQINKNYADKKPANNTNTAYNAKNNLLEELRKRRTNR
jgi:hypothetical protein